MTNTGKDEKMAAKQTTKTTGKHRSGQVSPAERHDRIRKIRAHVICITVAVVLSSGTSFFTGAIIIHVLSFALPATASVAQEVVDFIKGF
jgi:hypothetical protein